MYENGVNSDIFEYNYLFCHACLSSNRALNAVGDYIDIYVKICEKASLNLASQIYLCWECLALLKKIWEFKRKVENAQKILEYCINKNVPLQNNLSDLTISSTETTTFIPIPEDEYEDDFVKNIKVEPEEPYLLKDELTIKIEDVRGPCEMSGVKTIMDLSLNSSTGSDVAVKAEPLSPPAADEARRRLRWKRSALLVHKRICAHRYARHFLRPVSDELAPLYSRVVRRPADLALIRRRLRDGTIRSTAQFEHALLLMFSNALVYNSAHHDMFRMAVEFRAEALHELSLLSAAHAYADSTSPVTSPPQLRANPSPPTAAPSPAPPTKRRHTPQETSVWAEPARGAGPASDATWDWPSTDSEYLVPRNCFKKYKNTVLF